MNPQKQNFKPWRRNQNLSRDANHNNIKISPSGFLHKYDSPLYVWGSNFWIFNQNKTTRVTTRVSLQLKSAHTAPGNNYHMTEHTNLPARRCSGVAVPRMYLIRGRINVFAPPPLRCICHPPIGPQVRPTPSWEMPLGHPRPPAFHASPDLMKAAQPYKNLHSDDNPDFTQLKSRFQAISNPYFGHLSSNTMPLWEFRGSKFPPLC